MRLILLYILKGKYRAKRKMKSSPRKYNFLHILSICLTFKRVYSTLVTATTRITHTIIIIIIERTLNTEQSHVHSEAAQIPGRQDKGRRARGNFESHVINRRKMKRKFSEQFFLLLSVYRWNDTSIRFIIIRR